MEALLLKEGGADRCLNYGEQNKDIPKLGKDCLPGVCLYENLNQHLVREEAIRVRYNLSSNKNTEGNWLLSIAMRQYLWRHIAGSLTIPPMYAVEIKQFTCLLQKNYANLISYPHQTISTDTWNKNRNSKSSVYCKIQKMQGDRIH